ncbi:MAG: dienelactone hydrolase family protein [Pseudonocardia sp.]|nr:dienelactone hydrolase family protein [Pseudonocardia sp.]
MVGRLARPVGTGPWPAVLICHDGVGLNDYQRRRADHLAEHGYAALAMDYQADAGSPIRGRCWPACCR